MPRMTSLNLGKVVYNVIVKNLAGKNTCDSFSENSPVFFYFTASKNKLLEHCNIFIESLNIKRSVFHFSSNSEGGNLQTKQKISIKDIRPRFKFIRCSHR